MKDNTQPHTTWATYVVGNLGGCLPCRNTEIMQNHRPSLCHVSNCSRLARRSGALRRAGALPSQAWLERRGLGSCALPIHRELPFIYNWGVRTPFLLNYVTLQLHFSCSRALRSSVKRSTPCEGCNQAFCRKAVSSCNSSVM